MPLLSQNQLVPKTTCPKCCYGNGVARQREKRSKLITLRMPILPSRWVLSFRLHSSLTYAHATPSPLLSLPSHHKELVQPEQRDRVLLISQNCCVLAKLENISTSDSELKLMFCCILKKKYSSLCVEALNLLLRDSKKNYLSDLLW